MNLIRTLITLLAAALLSGPALADQPAVESALRAMQTAVLAGDAAAYLANVAPSDPVFLKEQQNWAKDLAAHTPAAFTLSIHQPPPPAVDDPAKDAPADGALAPVFDDATGVARFEMLVEWTMPGATPPAHATPRSVSYPVVFRRDPGGRWLYEGEDWSTIESGGRGAAHRLGDDSITGADMDAHGAWPRGEPSSARNRARFFPGFEEVAQRVVDVLPEVRAHVDNGFENAVRRTQEIKIYPSMRHLQESIYLSYVDGLSGWNEPGEAIKLLASNKASEEHLRPLLAHEYGHVATFELGPRATDIPWWVLEGVADLSAERFVARNGRYEDQPDQYGRDARATVERWARRSNLAAWEDITDFRSTKHQWMPHVYKQGQHMLGYISSRAGRTARNDWLRTMAQGRTIDQATREVLGCSFEDLDKEWLATLPSAEPDDDAPDAAAKPEPR